MRIFQVLDLPRAFLEVRRVLHKLHGFAGVVAAHHDVLQVEYHSLHGSVECSPRSGELRELTYRDEFKYRQDTEVEIGAEIPQRSHHHVQHVQRILFVHLVHVELKMALQLLSGFRDERGSRAVQPDILCKADILLLVVDVVIHAVHL